MAFLFDGFAWLPFLTTFILLTLAPGADTLLVMRNAMRGGLPDALVSTFAICCGLFVHATASALGIAAFLAVTPWAYQALKMAGALYLAWLGWSSLRASFQPYSTAAPELVQGQFRWIRSMREGFLSNVLNPKTMVVYFALLPQFIDPEAAWVQSMVLAGLHFMMGVLYLGAVALLVNRMIDWWFDPVKRSCIDRAIGASLMAMAGLLLAP